MPPTHRQVNVAHTVNSVQGGDLHIHDHQRGVAFDLQRFVEAEPEDPAVLSGRPSQLLLARNEVVGFAGRRAELSKLAGWRDSPSRTGAMLVYGPGGAGKTRLAAEFAKRSVKAGWTVLVAQRGGNSRRPIGAVPASDTGLLFIVDYAERWPREDLLALLSGIESPFTRILLLARSLNWWGNVRYRLEKQGVPVETERLGDLATDERHRRSLFDTACASFARAYRTSADGLDPAGSLNDDRYRSVLTIHMAALAVVDARSRPDGRPPKDPGALSAYLLDRERDHWVSMREHERIETGPAALGRAVFLATLFGPMSREAGVRLLRDAGLAPDDIRAGQILDDHRKCYPPTDGSTDLEPLTPDRLGEDFIARAMRDPNSDDLADPWAPQVSAHVLTEPARSAQRPRALAVLAEAAKRWGHVKRHLNEHLFRVPEQLVAIGGAGLLAVAEIADLRLLSALEPHLPDRDFELDTAAARVVVRLTDQQLQSTGNPVALARLRLKRGYRQGNAGEYELARRETELAVGIYRQLVRSAPRQHEPGLAEALHNLGSHLAGLGRWEAAIAATKEAAQLREFLARERADVYEPEFARTLDNLATDYSQTGNSDAALATAERAVAIHQRLAARSHAHLPALAASLHNLGCHRAQAKRWHDAIDVTQRAVTLYRRVVNDGQLKYEADLASALHDLGSYQHEIGSPALAARTTEQAVRIRKRLAGTNPARFEPDLALSYLSLANQRSDLGQHTVAGVASVQAIDVSRRLMAAKPDRYEASHGTVLHNHAIHLARLGELAAALDTAQQVVDLRSRSAESCLSSFELLLFEMLGRAGVVLSGRTGPIRADRLNGWELVTSIRPKPPQDADPKVHRLQRTVDAILEVNAPGGAHSHENLGIRLFRADRLFVALAAMAPAMKPPLVVPGRELKLREVELARSLGNLSARLAETSHPREALTTAEQAAEMFHRLAAGNLAEYHREFALSLANLGLRLFDIGRPHDALTATGTAVAALGSARDPLWTSSQAASVLLTFAWMRKAIRTDLEAGLRAIHLAAGIYHRLAEVEQQSFAPQLRSAKTLEWELFELARARGLDLASQRTYPILAPAV